MKRLSLFFSVVLIIAAPVIAQLGEEEPVDGPPLCNNLKFEAYAHAARCAGNSSVCPWTGAGSCDATVLAGSMMTNNETHCVATTENALCVQASTHFPCEYKYQCVYEPVPVTGGPPYYEDACGLGSQILLMTVERHGIELGCEIRP